MALYRRKDSPNWWYYSKISGEVLTGSTGTSDKKLAQAIYEKVRTDFLSGKHFGQFKTRLDDMVRMYLDDYSKSNKSSYRDDVVISKTILKFFGDRLLTEVTPHLIEKYKSHRLQSVSGARINRELTFLRHLFTMAIKWDKASENPLKNGKVKFFKEEEIPIRTLMTEEKKRLYERAEDFLKPMILTALHTGMRQANILKLKWEDVDFAKNTINIRKTKGKKLIEVPIHPELETELQNMDKKGEYVFSDSQGSPYTRYGTFRHAWDRALRRAGIRNFRFHDLRHTFASDLAMMGADLVTIKEFLGHSTLRMTERYAHLLPDHKKFAIQLLKSVKEEGEKSYARPTLDISGNGAY